jgi:N4-gp56 family major capsid protein
MTITNFKPAIWATDLLENLNKELVYANLCNRDYEGLIKNQGDEVEIYSVGRVETHTYTGADISIDEMQSFEQKLKITEAQYINIQIKDIDKTQSKVNLRNQITTEAGIAFKDVIDQFIAGSHTEASNSNLRGSDSSPITLTVSDGNAYEELVNLDIMLSKSRMSKEGRWIVVPPEFMGYIRKDDRFITFTETGQQVLRKGIQGRISNFDVYESLNVPNTSGTKYKIMAGCKKSISFAMQIPPSELEAYRVEKNFKDGLKGLCLYGKQVVRPDGLAVLTANLG